MWKALAVAAMIGVSAVSVSAQTPQDRIVELLLDQGFQEIRVSRTLLGRTRIVAENDRLRREIVLNPSTGVILRDFLRVKGNRDDDDDDPWGILGGYGDQDDEYDDDYDDDDREDDRDDDDRDDDDEDNSGPSDNSGSGSNSGSGGGDDGDDDDPDDD